MEIGRRSHVPDRSSSIDPDLAHLPSILWQSIDESVTLLDIPRSIATAQGNGFRRRLLSSHPLESPFPHNEPRSASAKAQVQNYALDAKLHGGYQVILQQAVDEIRKHHQGHWCLPRPFVEDKPPPAKKRKLQHDLDGLAVVESGVLQPNKRIQFLSTLLPYRPDEHVSRDYTFHMRYSLEGESDSIRNHQQKDSSEELFFCNDADVPILFQAQSPAFNEILQFQIPSRSSFYLGDCGNSRAFHSAIRNRAQEADTRKHFDFILLDPPWPNRSVKRTHKTPNSTYSTESSLRSTKDLIEGMDLDMLMVNDCLVGVWITNKPAVRELVLGECGVFACWGVDLIEEWIWLKTTVQGEPVTPLHALWRKPYEVLLLGRKCKASFGLAGTVKRRVVVSVPDLHSRKPCLKELIEPLIPDRHNYRALEIFARHLVAGWWSWGDECIKFNWDGFWRNDDETTQHPQTDLTLMKS